jgi:hypothetical protein
MPPHIASTILHTKTAAIVLGFLVIVSSVLYVYFLNSAVVLAVMEKQYRYDIQDTKTEIAELETRYITAQHSVTKRMAEVSVLVVSDQKTFVRRDGGDSLVLQQR